MSKAAPAPAPAKIGRKAAATREKILAAAARAIRRHGPAQVGVLEIMREAGLTHGGFYAHFTSKDDLIAAAVAAMFAEGRERFAARIGSRSGPDALRHWIESYVSAEHRDNPGGGCALAALMSDLPRLDATARAAFDEGVRGIAGRLARHLPPLPGDAAQALASSLMAEMAGAVALSRAVADPQLSDTILKNSRAALAARLEQGIP